MKAEFESVSDVAMHIVQYTNRDWKPAWLDFSQNKHSWFTIDRAHWGQNKADHSEKNFKISFSNSKNKEKKL